MTRMRLAIALITAAALVLLFVLVRPGGGNDETTTAATPTTGTVATQPTVAPAPQPTAVVWQVNANEAKIARKTVQKGARVTLVVTADHSEEVHVHGYDLKADVAPGKPAKIGFHADTPGRFEIELEHAGKQIAELTVEP
jgi:FtsP/CotA-like multicopper oxidase with cupredoxin domain